MRFLPLLLLLGAAPPNIVRVRLDTAAGPITVALDARRAPKTAANFLRYVDDGRFDGVAFVRAARRKAGPGGFIQGGIGMEARRVLPPVPLEPTSRTGLRHIDGAISMARFERENSATGNFSISVGANPGMDARPGAPGYAVFGRVVAGMDVVKRILAQPTGPGGSGAMKGQMLVRPVTIRRAVRLDGVARPTGRPKPWTLGI
ncbi:peptidylprolyl isomerase [Sphingomonas sp.]|jgi:peptidyl-prolyl cis-trans isomerase A (cyclophilin A)|uniref:peptidylprolyl isomerase n=1 Tax=Sphingomonas sp. TaxID=28214 RepID=UPI002D7E7FDA|nr:peptidylprolyl isomerase [Sphingomonas sp.]HEU0043330.1 peptidylprolyl isomerase [Sphingomonas sp.]